MVFLANQPAAAAEEKLLGIKVGPEEFYLRGRELYVYFPNGAGRSKFSMSFIEKTLQTCGTGRNWNTVARLLEMSARLER